MMEIIHACYVNATALLYMDFELQDCILWYFSELAEVFIC